MAMKTLECLKRNQHLMKLAIIKKLNVKINDKTKDIQSIS
jgi:hypothetical protein